MQSGGYLYIITNENFSGWCKVGITKDLKARLNHYQTSSPFRNYKLIYSIRHPLYLEAEKKIKDTLKPFAKSIRNEWYEVDITMAKHRLDEQLEQYQENL
jgi:predicted GIY-YIG superfamily endonuclease